MQVGRELIICLVANMLNIWCLWFISVDMLGRHLEMEVSHLGEVSRLEKDHRSLQSFN